MRRLAVGLRTLIIAVLRAIDVEGFLVLGGLAGIAWLAWLFMWQLGVLFVCVSMVVGGIAFARSPRSP